MSTLRATSRSRIEVVYELQQGLIETPVSPTSDEELARYLKQKYADKKFDLILSMVASRLRIILQKDPRLFENVPKIFYEFDSERDATNRSLGPNITGVWADLNPRKTLDFALALNPDTRKVVLVSGVGEEDGLKRERAQAEFRQYESRVEFSYITGHTIEELKSELATLDKRSIVMFLLFTRDNAGNRYSGPDTIPLLAPVCNAPIYGYSDTLMGLGITGGNLLNFEETGKRIGEMSQRVLAGEPPQSIAQETAPTVMTVDWRELQRWGISEQRLPHGTVVKFREASFWELYKWYAIGLVGAVILEAMLITWLLFLRARRRQAEAENLRLAHLTEAEHQRVGEIVSNVPGIVWETKIDPATHIRKTTFISGYVEKMLGYTPEEWLAQAPHFGLDIIPDEQERESVRRESANAIERGKDAFIQSRWRRKDGRVIWVESYLTPIFNRKKEVVGLRGVTLDVDSRKHAEENLRQTQQRNRAILRGIPDLIFLQTPDGVFLDFHTRKPEELLVPAEELIGKNMRDILPPTLAATFAECFRQISEHDEEQILEYKLTINQAERWFESRMVPCGNNILSVVRDITERLIAEESLRRSEAQLAGIISSAMDGIITLDENQRIILFNEAAEIMFGCSRAEAFGQTLARFCPERFRKRCHTLFQEIVEKDSTRRLVGSLGDLYGLRSSGEEFPIEASVSQIELSGETFYTIILRDITERKLAEAALKESELNYRSIFNAATDAILVHDLVTGAVLDVNERMCEMYGFTVSEARQASIGDLSYNEAPYTSQEAMSLIRKAAAGLPQLFEWRARKKSGELFWVEVSLKRVVLAGKDCLLAVVRDITERRKATDDLRQSEERFGKAFRANPQPMELSTRSEGRYLDVNDSFLAMSGYTRDEVIGHTSIELRVWESAETRADFVRELVEHGSAVNIETRFLTKQGSARTLLSSAEALETGGERCLLVASTDVTDRVLAQQAVQESEARFRNMADTAPVMIWVSGPDKLCTYFNQQWLDFTGRSMDQESGNGWAEGVHPDDYAPCLETYVAAFDRRECFRMEYRLRRADGAFCWVFDTGTPRFSATGEFLGYIGSCVDINDRKESEQELRRAHEEVSRLKNQLQEENIYLQEELRLEQNFEEIVGSSDALKYVFFKIEQVAPTDSTVLVTGETGTGKELVARAIHHSSSRKERPLVKVNCATLSPSLIESELFGHEKGAFTGASGRKIGRFELANGATIFLDEIGELPLELQAKLLRVIQEGELERLGSSQTLKVDVRIIAATNRNLDLEVKNGVFREDLWYRLNVFPITVPPLRQRREDIPLLVEHFARRFAKKLGKVITSISPATLKSLCDYSWPGNVRELANVIERATINSRAAVLKIGEDFETAAIEQSISATMTLEEMERDYIVRILEDRGWRIEGRRGAARLLGLNPSTLRTRMIKLGIQKPQTLSRSAP